LNCILSETEYPVVLGALSRLPVHHVEPFARSLRATGFRGQFCIVAAGYDDRGLEQLRALADRVRAIDDVYPQSGAWTRAALSFTRRQRGLRRMYPALFRAAVHASGKTRSPKRWRGLEFHLEGLQSLRYEQYRHWLLDELVGEGPVLISDLRDVVFQRDPFAEPVQGLEVYLEDESVQIGRDTFNTRWLRDVFGQEFVDTHHGHVVSCSGTVVGARQAMLDYLSKMAAVVETQRAPMGPHDQAVHNWLLRTGRLPEAMLVPNEHGRVITLGRVRAPRVSPEGLVLNADGAVSAVVHQWDRHPTLLSSLSALSS
jgi:hypothetical protein